MLKVNHHVSASIIRIIFIAIGAFIAVCIYTSCSSSKNSTSSDQSTIITQKANDSLHISKSEYENYIQLKKADSIRRVTNEKIPVVLHVNGKDTLVYRYIDKYQTKYNVKDSTVKKTEKKYEYWEKWSYYNVYRKYDIKQAASSKTSTGAYPFWVVIIALLVGFFLPKIWSLVKPRLFG